MTTIDYYQDDRKSIARVALNLHRKDPQGLQDLINKYPHHASYINKILSLAKELKEHVEEMSKIEE